MNSNLVFLVQTDTTVGFSSNSDEKLALVKKRPLSQKILRTVDSFDTLKKHSRVPKAFRKKVRNSKNKTFIYPNGESFRVIQSNSDFYSFIKKFKSLYSSSANLTGKKFDEDFAKDIADVTVSSKKGFFETRASSIYKLSKKRVKKLR